MRYCSGESAGIFTALMATPLCRYSTTCSAMRTPTISCASSVDPAICGVASTGSRLNSGKPAGGGSTWNASSAAPATLPDSIASRRAASSINRRGRTTMRTPASSMRRRRARAALGFRTAKRAVM